MADPSSNPLAAWQTTFNRDVLTLNQLILLRTRPGDEESRRQMQPHFKVIADAVASLDNAVVDLRRYVAEERAELQQMSVFREQLQRQKTRLQLIRQHAPEDELIAAGLKEGMERAGGEGEMHVGMGESSVKVDVERAAWEGESKETLAGKENRTDGLRKVVRKKSGREEGTVVKSKEPSVKSSEAAGKPKEMRGKVAKGGKRISKVKSNSKDASSSGKELPEISSVSQEELDSAPQYVKGRLTVDKIDRVVKGLNGVATAKYELLNRPYRDLNSNQMTQWQELRESECEEAAGKQFLTDAEIKGFGAFRLDATAKSVINILRHVGSLKEVRGKNKTRIFIIN